MAQRATRPPSPEPSRDGRGKAEPRAKSAFLQSVESGHGTLRLRSGGSRDHVEPEREPPTQRGPACGVFPGGPTQWPAPSWNRRHGLCSRRTEATI